MSGGGNGRALADVRIVEHIWSMPMGRNWDAFALNAGDAAGIAWNGYGAFARADSPGGGKSCARCLIGRRRAGRRKIHRNHRAESFDAILCKREKPIRLCGAPMISGTRAETEKRGNRAWMEKSIATRAARKKRRDSIMPEKKKAVVTVLGYDQKALSPRSAPFSMNAM